MKASQVEARLVDFIKGDLPDSTAQEISAAVQANAALKASLEAYRKVVNAEQTILNEKPAPTTTLNHNIMQKVYLIRRGLPKEGRFGLAQDEPHSWLSLEAWQDAFRALLAYRSLSTAVISLAILCGLVVRAIPDTFQSFVAKDRVAVLVPVRDIEPGQLLEPSMFRRVYLPKKTIHNEDLGDLSEIQDQYAHAPILAHEPLNRRAIGAVIPASQVDKYIPAGYRAVALRFDATATNLDDWATPSTRADVVWSTTLGDKPALLVIVPNARIISATLPFAAEISTGPSAQIVVTLMVRPQEANKIQLAQATGQVGLQLRGLGDAARDDYYPPAGHAITVDALFSPN